MFLYHVFSKFSCVCLGEIRVTKAFDYEARKYLAFNVIAKTSTPQNRNPFYVVTSRTRVRITVLDRNDNCPEIKSPAYFEVSHSSPIEQDLIVARIMVDDADSFVNHTFSINNNNFKIDTMGFIHAARMIESRSTQFYNVTVTVTDGQCTNFSYVGVRLTVCATPMSYQFTNNAVYTIQVREDQNLVDKLLTIALNGLYPRTFSIIGSDANEQFVVNATNG